MTNEQYLLGAFEKILKKLKQKPTETKKPKRDWSAELRMMRQERKTNDQ